MLGFAHHDVANDIAQSTEWARVVNCTTVQTNERSTDGTLYWRIIGPVGPRKYANLAAARWAVCEELGVCFRLAKLRHAMEQLLADQARPYNAEAWAWWARAEADEDDLSQVLPSMAVRLLRQAG